MIENNRSIRIRTKVGNDDADKYVSVKLDSDVNIIELLSLKIDTSNFYKMHTSDYGCIAGRVLANGGVGIPNAKISVFVSLDDKETADPIISALYPYSYVYGKDNEGRRYNLLPEEQVTSCHTPVGTFPSKRMVLDDDNYVEIFDKYYKYTTRSNDAGDYMIFGVPVGENIVHVDIDLSDIGMLSQRPRDMIYKGYNITQFENANKFKSDTNLDNLTQIISQNDSVYVYPFWGDTEEDEIKITRNDVDVQYKFEPTCIFLGSLITDERSQGISKKCIPSDRMGKMDRLTTGAGTIEMIRKTPDGNVEEKQIQGNQLIDGNGTWCYQIPMNLDYYMTDEYGNFVPSDDKEKGIPTRTRVRFRVSLTDFQSDYENNHLAKLLVPNNPKTYEDLKDTYHFGSATTDDETGTKSFRDLFWNKIYTVKQYIPRIQKGNNQRNVKFSGIKNINVNGGNNPIPYNNMRVNLTFMFVLQCAILKILVRILGFVNWLNQILEDISSNDTYICACMGDGICPDLENWYFAPRCDHLSETLQSLQDEDCDTKSIDYQNRENNLDSVYCITRSTDYLFQCIEINLAMEYEVIQFDFYNDWINGMLYVPHWYINYRKKRSYLFGLIRRKARLEACMEDTFGSGRRYTQQCALEYSYNNATGNFTNVTSPNGCRSGSSKQKCHKGNGRKHQWIMSGDHVHGGGGIVHAETTLQNQKAYYFKPAEWLNVYNNNYGTRCNLWATDIVLLGSMNECDEDGIPRIFEELTSSTFVMPSNLASTNMDNPAFMYGNSWAGTFCTQQVIGTEPLVQQEQTFKSYNEWSSKADYAEALLEQDDVTEYPVTEASGIDWGYIGPNQGGNNFDKLFYPGGHFLGISCMSSQVNVKSCVNLSRICEFGAIMSQRQSTVHKEGDNFKYDFLAPNGYISKFEITDSNFRRAFATMNYNGLKTKVDKDSLYRRYDIKYIHPTNFEGSLKSKVQLTNGNPYYDTKNDDTETSERHLQIKNERPELFDAKLYVRGIDDESSDYYYFRMGLSDCEGFTGETLKAAKRNKYLIAYSSDVVALPQYENSYYFYFGLSDGNTAIDRFYKDFYAPCNTENEDASYFEIKIHDDVEICSGEEVNVEIIITNVDSPYEVRLEKSNGSNSWYTMKLKMDEYENGVIRAGGEGTNTVIHNYSTFKIVGLNGGKYRITLDADDRDDVSAVFDVAETTSSKISGVTFKAHDFTTSSYNQDANVRNTTNGYLEFGNVYNETLLGILVATDEKFIFAKTGEYPFESYKKVLEQYISFDGLIHLSSSYVNVSGTNPKTYKVPAWKGNDTYYTFYIYDCNTQPRVMKMPDVTINMGVNEADIYFGDSDLTSRSLNNLPIQAIYSDGSWVEGVLVASASTFTEKEKWLTKMSTFYRSSMFDSIGDGVIAYQVKGYGSSYIIGNGEKLVGRRLNDNDYAVTMYISDVQYTSQISDRRYPDYHLTMNGFHIPTSYFDANGKYKLFEENGYNKEGWDNINRYVEGMMPSNPKRPYGVYLGEYGTAIIPSVYRPCYLNAVMLVNPEDGIKSYSVAVTNLVTYNNKAGKVKFNGTVYDGYMSTFVETFRGDCTQVKMLPEYVDENDYSNGNESFSFEVEEGKPKKYGDLVNVKTYSVSSECHFPCNESDNDFYYSNGMRFYYCTKTENEVKVDDTTINEGAEDVKLVKDTTIKVSNVTKDSIVDVYLRGSNDGQAYVIHSFSSLNLLTDTIYTVNGYYYDAEGKTVMDTVTFDNDSETGIKRVRNGYKCTVIDANGWDKLLITSNVEYNIFAVNPDGVIRTEQVNIVPSTDSNGKKTGSRSFIPKTNGKIVIWWVNTDAEENSVFKIDYTSNGKFNCGITDNRSISLFSAKIVENKTYYLDYIIVNDAVILGCKINGEQNKVKTNSDKDTYNYVNKIYGAMIPKDYSNTHTAFYNGIFGNTEYNVIEVTEKFTLAHIASVANSISGDYPNKKWMAFKKIINDELSHAIFAVYDDWTKLSGPEAAYPKYSKDVNDIWKHLYPDTNKIAMVKYYPKGITG